jgi:two-component system, OmpR family, sensor kinase
VRKWPSTGSVRVRLTLWYTLALAVPLIGFALIYYLVFADTLMDRTDAFLDDALTVFANELVVERRIVPEIEGAIERTVAEVRFRDLDILVTDEEGRLVAESAPYGGFEDGGVSDVAAVLDAAVAGMAGRTVRIDDAPYRVLTRGVVAGDRAFDLTGVYPLAEVERVLAGIRFLSLLLIPVLILAAALGGYALAARSLRPVSTMARRAGEIGASTLHERLPVAGEDELGALARVLNDLLDRLERSFEQQRRFMADASHELRTPTAIVRTESEVTLARDARSEEEYRASMEVVRGASHRLTRIVDDIFLLARADAGHPVTHPAPLYLDDVVADSVRVVGPLARARGVDIRVSMGDEAPVVGDEHLLGRLVLNLLDNAVKHSPEGGVIDVSLDRGERGWEIAVIDAGPGIPPESAGRIFDRFFRVDTARTRSESTTTSGAGLGLAIARRIAELHGGTLRLVSSRPGRTEFMAVIPGVEAVRGATTPAPGPVEPA